MNLVTSSLELPRKCLLTKDSAKALALFAQYTAIHLPESRDAQRGILNRKARCLGKALRHCLTNHSAEALMSVAVQLYRNIGIEMSGQFPEEVTVVRCHFSEHYTPCICEVASVIDSGVIAGLYAADRLCFTQRITEGKDTCCCHLSPN